MIVKCDACDDPPPMDNLKRCGICQVILCPQCWLAHYADRVRRSERSLCHQIESAAWMHARFRREGRDWEEWVPPGAEDLLPSPPANAFPPEEEDWIAARNHYLYDLRQQRPRC